MPSVAQRPRRSQRRAPRAPHVAFRVWNVHPSGLVEVLTPRGVS